MQEKLQNQYLEREGVGCTTYGGEGGITVTKGYK